MTVMDKIYGWEDEETWVGSKFAACMWICTKVVLTGWQKPTPEIEEFLKRRLLSIVLRVNLVCAGTCDDHEWRLGKHNWRARRSDGRRIGLRKLCPVCGAMVHAVVLCTNTLKSNIGKPRNKNRKIP